MPSTTYQRYMKSTAWRRKRRQVLHRCNYTCERCRKWPVVNVHHLTYERLGSELLEDLQGLCLKCHEEVHSGS